MQNVCPTAPQENCKCSGKGLITVAPSWVKYASISLGNGSRPLSNKNDHNGPQAIQPVFHRTKRLPNANDLWHTATDNCVHFEIINEIKSGNFVHANASKNSTQSKYAIFGEKKCNDGKKKLRQKKLVQGKTEPKMSIFQSKKTFPAKKIIKKSSDKNTQKKTQKLQKEKCKKNTLYFPLQTCGNWENEIKLYGPYFFTLRLMRPKIRRLSTALISGGSVSWTSTVKLAAGAHS